MSAGRLGRSVALALIAVRRSIGTPAALRWVETLAFWGVWLAVLLADRIGVERVTLLVLSAIFLILWRGVDRARAITPFKESSE